MRGVFLCLVTLVTGCDLVFPIEEPACQTSTPGYVPLPGFDNGSRYRVEEKVLTTWPTAEATCRSEGAHLFVPDTRDELTAMYATLPTFGITLDAWVGVARDAGDSNYLFVTGAPVPPQFWATGQPDTDQLVGVLVRDAGLRTDTLTTTNDFVCECDGQSVRSFSF